MKQIAYTCRQSIFKELQRGVPEKLVKAITAFHEAYKQDLHDGTYLEEIEEILADPEQTKTGLTDDDAAPEQGKPRRRSGKPAGETADATPGGEQA